MTDIEQLAQHSAAAAEQEFLAFGWEAAQVEMPGAAPDTPARVAIQKLARRLAGEVVDKAPPTGFINRLLGRNEKKPVKAS